MSRLQTRLLLFRLAAEMEAVSRDQLLLLFWPTRPEAAARRNLTRLISSLRKALPHPDLLLTDSSAVALSPQLATSDAFAFFRFAAQEDGRAWEEAVSLVGGPFLDGVALSESPDFDSWQTAMQQRVEREYLRMLTRLVSSKMEGGQPTAAIDYANQYLATDDLAETIHRQLITLYASIDEREAAMRQFDACVLVLERELGVEPLAETRAVYEAIQRGEVGQEQPAPARLSRPQWRTLPSLDLPLIGREKEKSRLEAALGRMDGGGVIFISGEPGIGKSRLMQAIATDQEATILLGYCRQATLSLPYQPLVEALRMGLAYPDFGEGVQPVWLAEAARLLPELKDQVPQLPEPIEATRPQLQTRLFEALAQVMLGLTGRRPLLLCLDDLHWADETTLSWLQFIAPRLSASGITLLATYRSDEAEPLEALLRTAQRSARVTDVRLGPLSVEGVAQIIDRVSADSAPPDLADRVHRMTGGNLFFLLETVRDLWEQELLESPPESLPVPASVLETVQRRVGRLGPLARQLLDAAAVLATNLTFDVIQTTTGRSDLEAADGLDELVGHQLLVTEGNGFSFQHDLVKMTVFQDLTPWRRRLLNRRAGDALATVFRQDLEPAAAQIAAHYDEAGQFTLAIRYYQRAANYAQRVYANHEAVQYYEKVLTLIESEGSIIESEGSIIESEASIGSSEEASVEALTLQVQISEGLGQVLRRLAYYDRAEQAYQSMRLTAAKLGDPEMLSQAWLRLGAVQDSLGKFSASLESAAQAETIAAESGLDATHAYALFAKAWALFRLERLEEALPIAQEALKQSALSNRRDIMALSQNTLGAIYKYLGQYEASEEHQQLALQLFQEVGDQRRVAGVLNNLGETARLQREYAKAHDYYQQAVTMANQIGERDWLVEFYGNLGYSQIKLGQFHDAEQAFLGAMSVARETRPQQDAMLCIRLAEAYLFQEKWADAIAAAIEALSLARKTEQFDVEGEAWQVMGRIAEKTAAPVPVGSGQHDAASCLAESKRLFLAGGHEDKAAEVTRHLSNLAAE
ncbi:MAG: AAA family ATPase [Chloroflexota bacterium]|nr:MAG: AAA family ATPase [Chloroflexota bacterium]